MAKKSAIRTGKKSSPRREYDEMPAEQNFDVDAGSDLETETPRRRSSRSSGSEMRGGGQGSAINRFAERFSQGEARDVKELLRELAGNPAVRYVAGGIATALLSRVANRLADRYPEISSFIKENVDHFEGKLGEYRSGLGGDARH